MFMRNILVQFQMNRIKLVQIRVLRPRTELIIPQCPSKHLSLLNLPQLYDVGIIFKKVHCHIHRGKLRLI